MATSKAPLCVCIAGPNGSGKSTLTKGLRELYDLKNWIDPDAVANEEIALSSPDPAYRDRQSFRESRARRVAYAVTGQTFGFETVYSHDSNLLFLLTLQSLGYEVHLYFVCTEYSDINVARVANRVAEGGHDVPEDRIRSRYDRSLELLSQSIGRFPSIVLFDNSSRVSIGRLQLEFAIEDKETFISLNPDNTPLATWVHNHALYALTSEFKDQKLRRIEPSIRPSETKSETLARFLIDVNQ